MKTIPITPVKKMYVHRCPHLNSEELCNIYETRPTCCRNFPGKAKKFPFSDRVIHTCNQQCNTCVDKCCKQIFLATEHPVPDDFIKSLTTECADCGAKFC